MTSHLPADDRHCPVLILQLILLFIVAASVGTLEDALADKLGGRALLQVAVDVELLLLLLLLFVRACRRGVAFFFLSSVIFSQGSLNTKQKHNL